MTHEEKLRALLPKPDDIQLKISVDDSDDCEEDVEQYSLERNYAITECFNALKDKVILREDLLTYLNMSDNKDRCGCVNHCGCDERDRLKSFLKKAGII